MVSVSVVIPVYGVEDYLDACLESVCAQTLESIEIICVDDCSPDACPDMLDQWSKRDERIRVVHLPENHGQGYARNVGLELAVGTYVYFLDSDDMVAPEALEELATFADADVLDSIFFDSQPVFESEELARRNKSYPACHTGIYPDEVLPGFDLFCSFIDQHDWTCYVQRQFWRRSFLMDEGLRFPDASAHEDEEFAFEALVLARRAKYIPRTYFLRRYREGSVMTTPPTARGFYSYFVGYCGMVRFVRERSIDAPQVDILLARIHRALVRFRATLLSQGENLECWFKTPEGLMAYRFFDEEQRGSVHTIALSEGIMAAALSTQPLYLYGAGVIARDVFDALTSRGAVIEGFLVSSVQGNPSAIKGRPVRTLADADDVHKDALVLIAVTDGYRAEIERALDGVGLKHCYWKD